ncbi:hypothetical protein [Actinacidiphila yeochonensis]|uniref:hypothetical protein n=1 Tax=Actinacidiphila yeochonensis TaxID=89050 RepID=UPI00055BC53A|nr:hypothetical protein [Actinacidiphila yeochonensis]
MRIRPDPAQGVPRERHVETAPRNQPQARNHRHARYDRYDRYDRHDRHARLHRHSVPDDAGQADQVRRIHRARKL